VSAALAMARGWRDRLRAKLRRRVPPAAADERRSRRPSENLPVEILLRIHSCCG
jgi:hypothetical protein